MKWPTPKACVYTGDAECLLTPWGVGCRRTATWQAHRPDEQAGQPAGARQAWSRALLLAVLPQSPFAACLHLGLAAASCECMSGRLLIIVIHGWAVRLSVILLLGTGWPVLLRVGQHGLASNDASAFRLGSSEVVNRRWLTLGPTFLSLWLIMTLARTSR